MDPSVRKTKQAGYGYVLVEFAPVDSNSTSEEFPLGALVVCSAVESRKRRQGRRDHTTVPQTDDEGIGSETDRLGTCGGRGASA